MAAARPDASVEELAAGRPPLPPAGSPLEIAEPPPPPAIEPPPASERIAVAPPPPPPAEKPATRQAKEAVVEPPPPALEPPPAPEKVAVAPPPPIEKSVVQPPPSVAKPPAAKPVIQPVPPKKPAPTLVATVRPPKLTVKKTVWHPKAERRVARIEVEGREGPVELHEGDAVGTLVVLEIQPSGVVFLHGGERLHRKVGGR